MCDHCRTTTSRATTTTTEAPTFIFYVKIALQYLILSSLNILYLFEIFINVCFFLNLY
jgi:hypothetical protein